jgi:hypothetical protein
MPDVVPETGCASSPLGRHLSTLATGNTPAAAFDLFAWAPGGLHAGSSLFNQIASGTFFGVVLF